LKIYVINLKHRTDRLEHMRSSLTRLGLEFERIEAVDGRRERLAPHQNRLKANLYALGGIPPGHVGCCLSHRIAWQKLVDDETKSNQCVVLEDDADLSSWDPRVLELDVQALGLDLLRLGGNLHRKHGDLRNSITKEPITASGQRVLDRELSFSQTVGTVGYVITRSGAEKMLACKRFWFPVDHFDAWNRFYGLRSGVVSPPLITPTGSESDIAPDRDKSLSKRFSRVTKKLVRKSINRHTNTAV
jgi:glycosyl transferase family 25